MARRLVVLWLVVAALVIGAVLTSASCTSYPSERECRGDKVNVLANVDDPAPANECTTCIQRQCCDAVGACADEAQCPEQFKKAHQCVIEAGAEGEPGCKADLVSKNSQELYKCIRDDRCGPACQLPTCKLNAAVTLFGSASCDRCVGSACCEQVNKCYENRQCKLFLECITTHCPNTLGPTLSASSGLSKGALEEAGATVCRGGNPPPQIDKATCFQRCVGEFTGDDVEARCLAFGVYTCSAGAGCGARCTLPTPVTAGAYPEDLDSGIR